MASKLILMDREEAHPDLHLNLKLNKEQKRSVKALQRQISVQSSCTSTSTTSGDFLAKLSEEELRLLSQVVESFKSYKQSGVNSTVDEADGRKIERYWSKESHLSSQSQGTLKYVNPGRLYVRICEEDVRTLNQVCLQIDKEELEESNENYTHSTGHGNGCVNGAKMESKNADYVWGYTVALATKENVAAKSNYQITVSDTNITDAVPFAVGKRSQYSLSSLIKEKTSDKSLLRTLPPLERFRQVVFLVMNNLKLRPLRKDWDFSEIWKKRGKATWLSIILTIVGLGAFFADIGTDLKVASDHFQAGSNWWASFTVLLVLLPSIFTNLVSFFWYKEDEVRSGRKPKHGWRIIFITHVFLIGLVERYWRILVKSFRIKQKRHAHRVVDSKLLIAMNLDMSMLQMVLAFTEDAPQLVLQLYVLISRHFVDALQATRIQDLWTVFSICFSFISYSRAVVNYISSLRVSKRSKGQLRWYGYLFMWLWRAFMIISRILTLVFFATEFKIWFFLVIFLHFVIVLTFLFRHEVYFFPGNKWKQHFIRVLVSYIHLFCFFSLEGVRTIRWAVKYYVLTFIENIILSLLWYTNETQHLPSRVELAGLIVIHLFFFVGLLMMIAYYKFVHPRFNRFRSSLPPPLKSADEDSNEGTDRIEREKLELWI